MRLQTKINRTEEEIKESKNPFTYTFFIYKWWGLQLTKIINWLKIKENQRDLKAIAWSYFGVLTFGLIFMIGDSKNITGNVLRIYKFTYSTFDFLQSLIIFIIIPSVFIYGFIKGRFK